jgi:cation diffusion facilitator CzcD-associated flavoprotein CzcO
MPAPNSESSPPGPKDGAMGAAPIILEQRLGTARPLRIITIGAGASGLNMAHQVEKYMQNVEHVIYEKNPDVGGTWFENRYPGCACDIPSHSYQFTWEPNPNWTSLYVTASPITSLTWVPQRLMTVIE